MNKFLMLALSVLLSLTSCATLPPKLIKDALKDARPAIVKLSSEGSSCTAFYVGGNKFISAAHCISRKDVLIGLTLTDYKNKEYKAKVIYMDKEVDVTVLYATAFPYKSLKFWSKRYDGEIIPGMPIMTMGYPGYYDTDFTFEVGHIKDVNYKAEGQYYVSSKEVAYQGESGGPAISLENGKVVGMVDMLSEKVINLNPFVHQHYSISLMVPAKELTIATARATLKR